MFRIYNLISRDRAAHSYYILTFPNHSFMILSFLEQSEHIFICSDICLKSACRLMRLRSVSDSE